MPGNYLEKERIPYHHHAHIPSVHSRKAGDGWPVDVALGPPMADPESGNEGSGKLSPSGVRHHISQPSGIQSLHCINIVQPGPPPPAGPV